MVLLTLFLFCNKWFDRLVNVKEVSETMRNMAKEMERVSNLIIILFHSC